MSKSTIPAVPNNPDQVQALRECVSAVAHPGHGLTITFHNRQIPLAISLLQQLAQEAHPGHTREAPEWRYDPATGFHRIEMTREPCRKDLSAIIQGLTKPETG